MRIFPMNILNLFISLPYSPFDILFLFLPAVKCMYVDFLTFILIYIMNILTLNFYSGCGYDINSSADFHKICMGISMLSILSLICTNFYYTIIYSYFPYIHLPSPWLVNYSAYYYCAPLLECS